MEKIKNEWGGNKKTSFVTLGASNHTEDEREINDFYATEPIAGEWVLKLVKFQKKLWECAVGQGHLAKVFIDADYDVRCTDIVDRGFGTVKDFLCITNQYWDGDIITNPPFKYAKDFILKALQIIEPGAKAAFFLKIQFMESGGRKHMFVDFPPKHIFITSSRILCGKNGIFHKPDGRKLKTAIAYAWYIWEKGFKGKTTVEWFN